MTTAEETKNDNKSVLYQQIKKYVTDDDDLINDMIMNIKSNETYRFFICIIKNKRKKLNDVEIINPNSYVILPTTDNIIINDTHTYVISALNTENAANHAYSLFVKQDDYNDSDDITIKVIQFTKDGEEKVINYLLT